MKVIHVLNEKVKVIENLKIMKNDWDVYELKEIVVSLLDYKKVIDLN